MFWRRHGAPGFSLFLEGQFDETVGHSSRPSFRLDLDGGSIAYHYEGGDIAVRTRSDYLVVAWLRTTGLETARAYMTARYLDRKKLPIPGTEYRSNLVGGPDAATDWQPITLGLPGNVRGARYIGISLWLTQERVWNTALRPPRVVEREDLQATAWFDDLTVYRLPRVSLAAGQPGGVFGPQDNVELLAEVSDPDGLHLEATLTVHSADGTLVRAGEVPILPDDPDAPHRTALPDLPVGWYHAELEARTDDTMLVRRELDFVKLPERTRSDSVAGRKFGVVLNSLEPELLAAQARLLRELHLEFVKLPVWSALPTASLNQLAIDRYLESIVDAGADPIGILRASHGQSGASDQSRLSLVHLLSLPPAAWQPLLAGTWSRYAGLIPLWQIGADVYSEEPFEAGQLVPALKEQMAAFISQPLLAVPTSLGPRDQIQRSGDYTSLWVPAGVPPANFEDHLRPLIGDAPQRTWLTLETAPEDAYTRQHQLEDLTRRLVEAAYQGTAAIFTAAPWRVGRESLGRRVSPMEQYLVLRTASDLLGDATPVSRFLLDGQAECVVFDRNGLSVLYLQDQEAPLEGRVHALPASDSAAQLDIWGRPTPLSRAGTQLLVRVGPRPMFVLNVPTWLVEFRRHFVLSPATVESQYEWTEHDVVFRNTSHLPISGNVRLVGPPDWEIRPARATFTLQPGEEFRQPVVLRFPPSAEAGPTVLVGEFEIDADRRYQFAAPTWFELGLSGLELETYAYRQGSRAAVRLLVTNRTDEPVHFEGNLLVPGRERITRLFTNFLPGATASKTFVMDGAEGLTGRKVRLSLKELQGTRVWNRVVEMP